MQFAYQVLSADIYLEGDVAAAIDALVGAAADADKGVIEERRKRWTAVHDAYVEKLAGEAKTALAAGKLDAVSVAATAAQAFPKDVVVCDETITHMPVMRPHLNLDEARSFFRVTGGALGQGIAAALGTKLAAQDRPVVLFVGDDFLYNPVIQALGASKTYEIPITIVVCNNSRYEAMRKGHVIYYEGGVSDTTKFHYGVNIARPQYHELGVHYGLKGFKVSTPDDSESLRRRAGREQGRSHGDHQCRHGEVREV